MSFISKKDLLSGILILISEQIILSKIHFQAFSYIKNKVSKGTHPVVERQNSPPFTSLHLFSIQLRPHKFQHKGRQLGNVRNTAGP